MITVTQLCNKPFDKSIAYILGLVYPLFKSFSLLVDGRRETFLVGSINHNPGQVSEDDLIEHFNSLAELIDGLDDDSLLYDNKIYKISAKKGFSVLIKMDGVTDQVTRQMLHNKVKEILSQPNEIKKYFIRGCFDGRGSYDTTMIMLSIDVDREFEKQFLIRDIASQVGIDVNLNQRGEGHPKNDQARVKKGSLKDYITKIGFFSTHRERQCVCGVNGVDDETARKIINTYRKTLL